MNATTVEALRAYWSYAPENGCWEWAGAISTAGYGQIFVDGRHRPAHRISYEAHVGEIGDGLHIDHLCRNRKCVNPDHLEPVTPVENIMRGEGIMAQNARKDQCHRGHDFDAQNTYITPDGGRMCRKCRAIAKAEYRARLRAAGKPLDWGKERKPCKSCGGTKSPGDTHLCSACKQEKEPK